MESWIAWILALVQTCIQWLASMQLLGVSVLWILVSYIILNVMIKAFIYKV